MRLLRPIIALLATAGATIADSTSRNPLTRLAVAEDPSILTYSQRVTYLSSFDLAFDLYDRRIRLSLEPNHDIIPDGAMVEYLSSDGEVTRREPIQRLDHKVFKGRAWVKSRQGGQWEEAGRARITVRRDGTAPLFEGTFSLYRDNHHVQMRSNYMKTRHDDDPTVEPRDDEFMVVWRDSDISAYRDGRSELRRREASEYACSADNLLYNRSPENPAFGRLLRRDSSFWGMPLPSMLGRRQLDNQPGGGNSAGVNLRSTIGNSNGCPRTRQVALVGVATDCTYTADFENDEAARQNVISQMNSASDLFENTFNITLGLANLTLSERNCPGSPQPATPWNRACTGDFNIQQRLNSFSQWRGDRQDRNSHWTLLSKCPTGSAVGLAWLGQACMTGAQGNNGTDNEDEVVAGANVVIRTSTEWQVIAHETGHTFGAVHDCTADECGGGGGDTVSAQQCCPLSAETCDAGEQFMMNPSTAQGIDTFSPCSLGNICSAFLRNSVRSDCFTNNRNVPTISGQQCGNGIVEDGEDCDCGGPQGCGDNPCCDPTTCRFRGNSVCDDSNEDCCRDCQFATSATVCRPSTGQCDQEERCTGSDPYCPDDVTSPDGESCGNNLECSSGQCTSRDQQCRTVMGSYTQNNDTYACDDSTCQLSCASPEFGANRCYGLQQNFLDGTSCSGGGRCSNVSFQNPMPTSLVHVTCSPLSPCQDRRANASFPPRVYAAAPPSAARSSPGSSATATSSSASAPASAPSSSSSSRPASGPAAAAPAAAPAPSTPPASRPRPPRRRGRPPASGGGEAAAAGPGARTDGRKWVSIRAGRGACRRGTCGRRACGTLEPRLCLLRSPLSSMGEGLLPDFFFVQFSGS